MILHAQNGRAPGSIGRDKVPTLASRDLLRERFGLTAEEMDHGYVRLAEIVGPDGILPIGRSTWFGWIAQGRVLAGLKIGAHTTVWPRAYIRGLVAELATMGGQNG